MTTIDPTEFTEAVAVPERHPLWARIEGALEQLSDRLNPILVKESRQALKSRQFTITFVLLLMACWVWSLGGVAIIGPSIFYSAQGPDMFFGYYLILAFPLMVIVPFSAYRSLASEREDNTYDVLSITTLSPRQVISGKLGSAMVQMVVYFSAIAPCLAFTYLLRGIDIVTIGMLLIYTFLASLGLSAIGLLAATITRERYGQVIISVALILGLVLAFGGAAGFTGEFLRFGASLIGEAEFWPVNLALLNAFVTYFALVFLAAAAQLTFASENRATALRVVMLIQQVCFTGWMAYAWWLEEFHAGILAVYLIVSGLHWYVMGILMNGESPLLSPRVRRRLPQSFLGRAFLTWFNPGPGTGLMFAVVNLLTVCLLGTLGAYLIPLLRTTPVRWGAPPRPEVIMGLATVGFCYVVVYLGLGQLLVRAMRRALPLNLFVSTVLQVLILSVGIGVPTSIQLMSPALRTLSYSLWQFTNPPWTIIHFIDRSNALPAEATLLMIGLSGGALIVFLLNFLPIVREVSHVRVAKPQRIVEDEAALAPPAEPVRMSPWD